MQLSWGRRRCRRGRCRRGKKQKPGQISPILQLQMRLLFYTGCEGEAITPYTSTVGQQEKSVWKWTGTYFQYYDENGNLETIAQLEAKEKSSRYIYRIFQDQ